MTIDAEHEAVTYRPMTASDLPQVVGIHREVFSGYFMVHMGPRFISLYYAQYLDHPHAIAVVAVEDGRIIGFIAGGRDVGDLEKRFYRRHFLTLGSIIATRFALDREARASIWARRRILVRAVRSVIKGPARDRKPPPANPARHPPLPGPTASVLSIAVPSAHRGRGIGFELNNRFIDRARASGAKNVRGIVLRTNTEHVNRKMRAGWRVLRDDPTKVVFVLDLEDTGSDVHEGGGVS